MYTPAATSPGVNEPSVTINVVQSDSYQSIVSSAPKEAVNVGLFAPIQISSSAITGATIGSHAHSGAVTVSVIVHPSFVIVKVTN